MKARISKKKLAVARYALYRAISEKHPRAVKTIMWNVGFFGHSRLGPASLKEAGRSGSLKIVKVLLDAGVWLKLEKIGDDDYNHENAFGEMARYGSTAVAKLLIENYKDFYSLQMIIGAMLKPAIMNGRLKTLKMLMRYKYMFGPSKCYVPRICIASGHVKILEYFLTHHSVNPIWKGCLLNPIEKGHLEMVRYLIDLGANVDTRSKDRCPPLMLAVKSGNLEMVKLLLEKGAKIDRLAWREMTPLMLATKFNNYEMIQLLLLEGSKIMKECRLDAAWFPIEYKVSQDMMDFYSKFHCPT